MSITVGNRIISHSNRPYFIADIASNHDGDLDRAYKLIELAKEAGADAAKFQNFKADKIVSDEGFKSLGSALSHQAKWKKSVYEVYKDASIPDSWVVKLKAKCDQVGIDYMTSPYDFESVDLAEPYLKAFKIGSGDITWLEILEYIANKDKPIFLATGASKLRDVDRAVNKILQTGNDKLVLMQCNTNYTGDKSNFKHINLNVLNTYKEHYDDMMLGLSDHTKGYITVLGAVALGARVIEKHLTDDNNRVGPDHGFSMIPDEFREMVDKSNELFSALGDGYKRIESNEQQTVMIQRRGLYFTRNIKEGEKIKEEDLIALRPKLIEGIEPYYKKFIVGKKTSRNIYNGESVKWEDIVS